LILVPKRVFRREYRLLMPNINGRERPVVLELESGRFDSLLQACEHYGITGSEIVRKWLDKIVITATMGVLFR